MCWRRGPPARSSLPPGGPRTPWTWPAACCSRERPPRPPAARVLAPARRAAGRARRAAAWASALCSSGRRRPAGARRAAAAAAVASGWVGCCPLLPTRPRPWTRAGWSCTRPRGARCTGGRWWRRRCCCSVGTWRPSCSRSSGGGRRGGQGESRQDGRKEAAEGPECSVLLPWVQLHVICALASCCFSASRITTLCMPPSSLSFVLHT
mmetsp:Transcript_15802/g.25760  ORF Transcript_15802/g.25760 Transcript_15802/m.25760 type:complete len:208 (-) Transcript_15802:116-739(-)